MARRRYRQRETRRQRYLESQSKKTIILSVLGVVFLAFIMLRYGAPLIANLAFRVSGLARQEETETKPKDKYLAAPVIDPLPEATNSAQVIVSGNSVEGDSLIEIYVNNSKTDEIQVKDGQFTKKISLQTGINVIKAAAKTKDSKSSFSQAQTITVDTSAPSLEIDSPTDGQEFSKDQRRIVVEGRTDEQSQVTVNGMRARLGPDNKFSIEIGLSDGENKIKIEAQDIASNKSAKEITVKYSP